MDKKCGFPIFCIGFLRSSATKIYGSIDPDRKLGAEPPENCEPLVARFACARTRISQPWTDSVTGISTSIIVLDIIKLYKVQGRSQGDSRVMTPPNEISELPKKCLPWAF